MLRFSLRGLFIAISIVAVLMGIKMASVRQLRDATNRVRALDGKIEYKHQFDRLTKEYISGAEWPGPSILSRSLGDDFFATP